MHAPLVAWNDGGGKHERIARLDLYVPVFAIDNLHQARIGLALRAGGEDEKFVIFYFIRFFYGNDRALFGLNKAERLRDLDVRFHGIAGERDPAADALADLYDLGDARKERGERGNNDAALGSPEYLLKIFFYGFF